MSETKPEGPSKADKPDSIEEPHIPEPGPSEAEAESDSNRSTAPAVDLVDVAQKELLYLRAEFENYRKRMARDQESALKFANERLVRELVPILDLFDRAMAHSDSAKNGASLATKTFIEGVELTGRELLQTLTRFGVEVFGAPGDSFDPAKHEAISEQETEEIAPGKIVHVLNKGCVFQGRLLHPAKVVVSKKRA